MRSRRLARRLGLAVMAILALVALAACTDGGDTTATDDPTATDAPIADEATTGAGGDDAADDDAAAEGTPADPSVLIEANQASLEPDTVTTTTVQEVQGQTITTEGTFTTSAPVRGSATATLPGPTGEEQSFDMIVDDTVIYYRFPPEMLPSPTEWVRVDTEAAPVPGFEALQQAAEDPTIQLSFLNAASDVREIGSEEVAGQPTTHYRYEIDFQEGLENVEPEARAQLEQVAAQLGDEAIQAEAWIGDDGRVYQQRQIVEVPEAGEVVTTVTFTEYDAALDAEAPPEGQVTDLETVVEDLQAAQQSPAPGPAPTAGATPDPAPTD